jgi:HSP20 family protein
MSMERYNPLEKLQAIRQQVEELSQKTESPLRQYDWLPATDVLEELGGFRIFMDLPGVNTGDFQIEVQGSVVIIGGFRDLPYASPGASERKSGRFERTITLEAPLELGKETASVRSGVLELYIPKAKVKSRTKATKPK